MADRCGTDRGYWVHRNHGEGACKACEDAHEAELAVWKAARRRRAEAPPLAEGYAELTAVKETRLTPGRCGTPAGLLAHQWRAEPPCDQCAAAWDTLGTSRGRHNADTFATGVRERDGPDLSNINTHV